MKVLFLDFDGVLNSQQSAVFWHHKRDQSKWENEVFESWQGTLREFQAQEFCPVAVSNVEELIRRIPGLKVVVSSAWRNSETIDSLKKIFSCSSLIADAIIDKTPHFRWRGFDTDRGFEIKDWLDRHSDVTHYVIIDDDSDMLDSQKENFVKVSELHGFQYGDMLWALRILREGQQR